MKKLYTLLCAAAVTAMAASAAAPRMQCSAVTGRQLNTEVSAVKAYAATPAAKPTLKMNAPAKAGVDYGDITGDYLMTGCYVGTLSPVALKATVAKGEAEGEYTIEFPQMGSNKLKATVAMKDVEFTQGTASVPVFTINGNGTQVFASSQGTDFYFWTVGINSQGNFVRFTDDFELAALDGELFALYSYGIGWLTAEGRGNGLQTTEPYKVNALASASSMQNGGSYKDITEDIHAAYDSSSKTITIVGMAGFGTPIKYTYDSEMQAYTASNVIMSKEMNDNDATDTNVYDFKLWSIAEQGIYAVAIGVTEDEGGYTYMFSPYEMVCMCDTDVAAMQGFFFRYKDYTVQMPQLSSLDAGVKDIVAGEAVDTDAPVEYFNLQGVRVAEPAAGLYIRRQGKTVSKVVIR